MIEKIGLGSVQFGLNYGISNNSGITAPNEVKIILDYARGAGIGLIDTAFGYGSSEEVLGSAGIEEFQIVSKFLPATAEFSIKKQVHLSIQRLRVDKLYGLLAHRPDDVASNPEIWDYLLELKQNNLVQKIGFSFNTPVEADIILSKGFTPDLIQVPFNYFDRRFATIMEHLSGLGCEIHTRSTFLQGLFFVDTKNLSGFFDQVKPLLNRLQENGNALPGLLLNHCLQFPFIDKVILGVNNKEQLSQIIESVNKPGSLDNKEFIINPEILTPSKWPAKYE